MPLATVQRLLRHSDSAITAEVYGHLDVEDMRKALATGSTSQRPSQPQPSNPRSRRR